MNILLATGIYPPESGGPATYTRDMAHALVLRGHVVRVISYGEIQGAGDESFFVTRVSRRGGIFVRYARYTWALFCAARKADLIFVQGAVSEGLPATLVAKLLGKKMVMRIPGDYAWEMGMQISPKDTEPSLDRFLTRLHRGRIRWYEWIERWTSRSAYALIAPSQYLRLVALRFGVVSDRIHVIKNAVQALPSTKGRTVLRQQFGVSDRVVCFTAVRALPWKGVSELISWWHRLPSTHVLVVAGDGPELARWKQLAIAEDLGDRIQFLGRLHRQEMAEWYDMADALILHTGYEGYPHTVPEAISRGVSCFVSDQGGNPETKEEFGDQVVVLPYQDRDAWVVALRAVRVRDLHAATSLYWTHADMVKAVENVLQSVVHPGVDLPMRVIMVGYERELLKTESETFARVSSLAADHVSLSTLVLGRMPEDVELERDGLHVQAYKGGSLRRIYKALRTGVRDAKRLPTQTVISAQDPFVAGCVAYGISRWTNQPLEIQEHGDFWSGEWVKERLIHRVWSVIGLSLLRRAERVRVVSERVKEHLVERGISMGKIDVIPVAQDVEKLRARPLTSFSDHRTFTFVAPCRFVPQKGLDLLLEAFVLVREHGIDARLCIIGSGPRESWLRDTIRKQNLEQVAEVRGWKALEDLWEDAQAFVLSSRYEGWGRTIVEAMAAGIPVITTDVGCVGSFFRREIDGFVVPVGDADALAASMERVIADAPLREQMRATARERTKILLGRDALHTRQRAGWSTVLHLCRKETHHIRFELWVGAFILFALATRTASVILFHGQLVYREWGFYTLVDRWFHGYGYSFAAQLGCGSAYRSPGFLFFLTGLYKVFDPTNTWAQAIVQNIFVVGALWLTYLVGKHLVGRRAALVGAFIMACYPYTFYHYTQYYHTFLQSFFLLLVLWCVLRLDETRKYSRAVAAGFAIGVLAYVQGTILPATPLISLWILWRFWPDWKRAVLSIGIMAICAAALIAPWTYRNWVVFHRVIPLTTDLGHALFKANNENIYELTKRGYPQEIIEDVPSSTNPLYKQYRLPPDLEATLRREGVFHESILWTEWHPKEPSLALLRCEDRGVLDEYTFNQYWLGKTKEFWHEHFYDQAWKLPLQKISTFWRPGLFPSVKTGAPWSFANSPWKVWLARSAVWFSTALVIVFGWIGVILHLRRRDKNVWLPLILFMVFTCLHAMLAGYTKYRIPLDHLLAGYAGYTLLMMWDWVRGKQNI